MEDDLSIIAKEYALQGYQNSEDILSRASDLEGHLNDVFCSRQPITRDYDNRRDLIRILNEIAKEIYGKDSECPVVEEFGSFSMDMFSAKSDLDLSINFCDKNIEARRDIKIKALRKFANKFYSLQKKKHVTNVQAVLSARVPVLKVTDCGTGIECDLSVGNNDAIAKSHIILLISSIDERFKKLCFLMKAWAKAHDINSSKDGTLNSLSLVLLSAFHLQNREPPILPPFSEIFTDGIDLEAVEEKIPTFLNYGNRNKESLATLFVSLLVMLESVETLWATGLCASTYQGSWIYKTWNSKKGDRNGLISTEDFTDRSQNTARAVTTITFTKIFTCICRSIEDIRSFTSGTIDAETLMNQLFGTNALTENDGIKSIAHSTPTQQPNLQGSTRGKRKQAKEKKDKKKSKKHKISIGEAQAHAPPPLNPPLPTPARSLARLRYERSHANSKKKPNSSSIDGVQAPAHTNPPVQSSVGLRNEGSHAETLKNSKPPNSSSISGVQAYTPPPLNPPLPIDPPARSSVGLRNEGSHAKVLKNSKKRNSSSICGVQTHTLPPLNPSLPTNSPARRSVGLRNEGIYAEMWRSSKKPDISSIGGVRAHAPSHLNPPLHSNPPFQNSIGFTNEANHAEIWRYSNMPGNCSVGGVQAHALPHLNPPVHSNPHFHHAEIWRNSNMPDNCSIGMVQAHAPPHFRPPLHTNPPIQHSVGFREERSHAEIWSYPTPNHHYHHEGNLSLASRSGSGEMPCYPTPYVPHPVPCAPPLGFPMAYNASQPLPSNPFSGPGNMNLSGFASYNNSVETNHRPNPGVSNGAYPPLIYRAP